ncbi:MAG: hypothetical protein LBB91_09820 [Clostridiales bacterium]|jgi:hypothetical protein|nr:hypothetical protein [Clostridiales bacterium]
MKKNEFMEKLASIKAVEPDELDRELLAEIDRENDPTDKGKSLTLIREEREFNGRILLRIPNPSFPQKPV